MKLTQVRIATPTLIWAIVIVLTLIWGSSFIMLKRALEVFTPGQVFAGRMTTSALVLLPFAVRDVFRIPRNKWPAMIVFAILANFFMTLFYAIAQSGLDSSLNGMLNALTPLMTFLVGVLLYRQSFQLLQWLGLLLGLLGTLILILVDSNWQIGLVNSLAIFSVLATFCYGFVSNLLKFNLQGLSVLEISSVGFLIVLPISLGYALYSGFFPTIVEAEGGWNALSYIIVLAIFANVVGILLLSRLVQLSSPVFASLITYLMPFVALFWGVWDGEEVTLWDIGAMLLGLGKCMDCESISEIAIIFLRV